MPTTPLYQVLERADGRKTYPAFNATKAPIAAKFSDGQALAAPAGKLARRAAIQG